MRYQITVNGSYTPCFVSKFEGITRMVAKMMSVGSHSFSDLAIWEFDENLSQIPSNACEVVQNPTKLIGMYAWGKYRNIDWRKDL